MATVPCRSRTVIVVRSSISKAVAGHYAKEPLLRQRARRVPADREGRHDLRLAPSSRWTFSRPGSPSMSRAPRSVRLRRRNEAPQLRRFAGGRTDVSVSHRSPGSIGQRQTRAACSRGFAACLGTWASTV